MTRRARAGVALGALALAALLLLGLWQVYAPGAPPEVEIRGCDFVFLHESQKLDAGATYRDYDLLCVVKASPTPPPCDEVMARYLSAKGPLPKDVNVIVRGEDNGQPDICRSHFHGDGTR